MIATAKTTVMIFKINSNGFMSQILLLSEFVIRKNNHFYRNYFFRTINGNISIAKIAHGHILFALDAEDREDEYHGEYGEEHAGDGADGEIEPEDFLGAVGEEWEEAEDGGDYG